MPTWFYYMACVLIWGTTFYAIRFQHGVVQPEVSVVYRFALAALILAGYCRWQKVRLRCSAKEHVWLLLFGVPMFSINYLLTYYASPYLTSGLLAVVFSTLIIINVVNLRIFYGVRPTWHDLVGGAVGISGVGLVFNRELSEFSLGAESSLGLILIFVATFSSSLGNVLSVKLKKLKLPIATSNAWGMAYGTLFSLFLGLGRGLDFNYDPAPHYTLSLLYLILFGSIFAFGAYLTLLARIGPTKAAYITVVFPIVALAVSTIFEGYVWHPLATVGVVLTVLGNMIVLSHKKTPA